VVIFICFKLRRNKFGFNKDSFGDKPTIALMVVRMTKNISTFELTEFMF